MSAMLSAPQDPEAGANGAKDPSKQAEVGIGLAAVLGFISSGATAVLSIARSKVTAVVLGPVGVGMTAEVNQIVTMVMAPVSLASGPALIGAVAEGRASGDEAGVARAYQTATTVTVLVATVGIVLCVAVGSMLLPKPWGPAEWPWTLMAAAGAAGLAWAAIPSQTLIALGALRRLTVVSLATATVSTVLVVVATWLFALDGQFVAIAVAGLAAVPITYALASTPLRGLRWRVSGRLDSAYGRRALRIGVASLVAALTAQGMLFTIRWSLEARGGPALNGQFQAAWAIGAAYFGLVLSSLGNYAFPRYAAASSSAELAQELDDTLQFLFRITPPIIILAVGFRREIVEALYSHKFDPAVELMGIQMTGDFAKAVSWAHAGPLLYRGRIRAFLCTEVFASGTMIATVIPLVHRYGLDGVGYAYVITYASYVVVTAVALRIDCSVPFRLRYLLGTAAVTAALILMVPLERRVPSSRWLFAVGAIIWLQRAGVLAHLREGIRARARRVRSDPS